MIPNIHIYEQLMFERCQERQHAAAQQRMAAGVRRERHRWLHVLIVALAELLITSGSSVKQLERRKREVTYD